MISPKTRLAAHVLRTLLAPQIVITCLMRTRTAVVLLRGIRITNMILTRAQSMTAIVPPRSLNVS